jgi:hypothetical protein
MRAGRSDVIVFALAVDAKDESAANFYRHFGSRELSSLPNQFLWVIGK